MDRVKEDLQSLGKREEDVIETNKQKNLYVEYILENRGFALSQPNFESNSTCVYTL